MRTDIVAVIILFSGIGDFIWFVFAEADVLSMTKFSTKSVMSIVRNTSMVHKGFFTSKALDDGKLILSKRNCTFF